MKITILDGYLVNPGDLSWSGFEKYGEFKCYDLTPKEKIVERIGDSDAIFTNKCYITREIMEQCPNLKFIGVTATGFDKIDIDAARDLGIAFCNVPAYSTDAVAQHTFALILELTNLVGRYSQAVKEGKWYESEDFTFYAGRLSLLAGKSLGIVGYGNIGKRVAVLAEAFGMTVNIYSRDREAAIKSDIVSLHCPLDSNNRGFVNAGFISQMKDGAILINTARGGLINEPDLVDALKSGKIAAAGLDGIGVEPPVAPNELIELPNVIVTPHVSWLPTETRGHLIDVCEANLKSWLEGGNLNRIV